MTSDRSPGGPMMTWLQADISSTTRNWIIAFWHHPPYSKGSHNSDTEQELIQMRQNALPILENYGVDLVLTGHSHSYERSLLLDGHYGSSGTLTSGMIKDSGSGREDGTGAYEKPDGGTAPHQGAVYAVAGSSGQASGGTLNHPAMFISLNNLGSMVLDVDGNRLDAKFLRETGAIGDYFTILKGGGTPPPSAPAPPTNLRASVGKKKVNLTWSQSSSPNIIQNKVYRSTTNGGPYTLIATLNATASYTDTTVASRTTYYFVVTAVNSSNLESANSNQISAKPK
jgi:hypothetical protein